MGAAIITWPGYVPSAEQLLAERLEKIRADFEWPRLSLVGCDVIVDRDAMYWRRLRHDELNRQRAKTCRCCRGTREMLVYIDEPAEPCARCQVANPFDYIYTDEEPF